MNKVLMFLCVLILIVVRGNEANADRIISHALKGEVTDVSLNGNLNQFDIYALSFPINVGDKVILQYT